MVINLEKFENFQNNVNENLEMCMYLSTQIDSNGNTTKNNLIFPDHLSDERISNFIQLLTSSENLDMTITCLPVSRQKLVIF